MKSKKWTIQIILLALLMLSVAFFAFKLAFAQGASVWTDKEDYAPEETVTIYGAGFTPYSIVTVSLTRPDGHIDQWSITADESGGFTTTYQLDGITGTYTLTATDRTNTATTAFTDTVDRYFTATISPTTAATGETKSYTITITNDMSSSSQVELGSAKVTIPSGFTAVTVISVTSSSGKNWSAIVESGEIKLKPNSPEGRNKLSREEWVSVNFRATAPTTTGTYEWTTRAYVATDWTGSEFTIKPPQPTVTVTAPPPLTATITFSQIGVDSDFTDVVLTVDDINYSVSDLPKNFTWVVGSEHTFAYYSPLRVNGKQYVWTSTSGLSMAQSGTITVSSDGGTVTGFYKTQFNVTISQSGVGADFTGTVVVVDVVSLKVADLPISYWWDSGSSHSFAFQSPLTVDACLLYTSDAADE